MMSRISNMASKEDIEMAMNAKFEYVNLYTPTEVINGLKETSLCVVTSDVVDKIKYGIWGILPVGYKNSWKDFQAFNNTLNINVETLKEHIWLEDAFQHRRCLIIATGFYSSKIRKCKIYPYNNTIRDDKLFCFAGIYNIIDDGFITFGILSHTDRKPSDIIEDPKPIVIKKENYSRFLGKGLQLEELIAMDLEIESSEFISYPVSKKVLKN